MTTATKTRFTEQIAANIRGDIDEDAGVVRNVRILGRESKQGRTYSDNAMRQAAALYEGVAVNIDHSTSERSITERFGQLKRTHFIEADGEVRGDLDYLKSHSWSPTFVESVKRFDGSFGLSHDAEGSTVREGGRTIVESIEHVFSVDIVGRPATNQGLFESEEQNVSTKTIRQIIEANPQHECACLLGENIKEDAHLGDVAVAVGDGVDSDMQIKAAFSSAAVAIFDDSSLSSADALGKLRKLLKARDSVTGDGSDGNSDPPDKGKEPVMSESEKKLRQELNELKEERQQEKAKAAACKLLESANVEPTDIRVNAVVRCDDDKERKALIEDLPKHERQQGSGRPASSPPKYGLTESDDNGDSDEPYDKLVESHGRILFGSKNK